MANRLRQRGTPGLVALGAIVAITVVWWALALWPLAAEAPQWLSRTRLVCFGAGLEGMPDASGWMLLIGEPIGMTALLIVVWGRELREGLRRFTSGVVGQIATGTVVAGLVGGLATVALRIDRLREQPFDADPSVALARQLTRVDDVPAALGLVDQSGSLVTLDRFRGRAVLVTFAFAHCETVCPTVVHAALAARDRLIGADSIRRPAIVVVTIDPWRDTPSRLSSVARQWGMDGEAHVLSGSVEAVERVLSRWRVPRARNERTGDLTHPALVYVIGPNGRITYVVEGTSEHIVAALRAL
jgi:cytochrome oxidase Cu insertion factor (SCO1/SenC/PrrC family)